MSKKSQLAVVTAVAMLSFLSMAAVFNVSGQSSRDKEKDAEVQWEYMVVSGGTVNLSGVSDLSRKQPDNAFAGEASVLQRNLDKLGQKGWELVTVHGSPAQPVYYLKRQKGNH
ncbi:MAG: hypothetical protein JST85_09105 [Acidobacteria bacterium]|nr:hypothetical protein [Acidobacteriota bacterium]